MEAKEVLEGYRNAFAGMMENAIGLMRAELTPTHAPSVMWHVNHTISLTNQSTAVGLFVRRFITAQAEIRRLESINGLMQNAANTVRPATGIPFTDPDWIKVKVPDALDELLKGIRSV